MVISEDVRRSGKATSDLIAEAVAFLHKDGIVILENAIDTAHIDILNDMLSKEALDHPEEMHAFYREEGIEDVCFNVEESEGDHVSTLMTMSRETMRSRFQAFLLAFRQISRRNPGIRFIREIDGLIPRTSRPEEAPVGNDQVEPFSMLNVDVHGSVSSFSPELLGYKNELYNNFIVGNVHQHTLAQMLESTAMRAMITDINAGVEACRRECGYFSICGGGAPVNKLSENGSFASTQTSFCNLVQITPANLILSAFEEMEVQLSTTEQSLPRAIEPADAVLAYA